jgi:ADP-heptose:LPS heptosyltransferase
VKPVLVLRRGGLGDTLLMLPVVAALRAAHPGADLHFAGVREFADVLASFAAVDRALSSEALQLWALTGDTKVAAAARERLCSYERIVADDGAVMAVATETRVQVFDPRPQSDAPLGQQIAAQLGLRVPPEPVVLAAAPPVTGLAPRAPIVLAPGSGSPEKCWPRARWLELATALAPRRPLVVAVGEAERERDDPTRWRWPVSVQYLTGLTAVELAQALRKSAAFVGNDSGTTHLAALLSLPTVAIFGPSRREVFAPIGPRVTVVGERTSGPPTATVAEVLAALLV